MASARNPAARLLGIELRDWRVRRHKTGDQVARVLRCVPSTVTRMEHGALPPDEPVLDRLLTLYQVPGDEAGRLRALAGTARSGPASDQDAAAEVLLWAPDAVPEALRTETYARAVMRSVRRIRPYPASVVKAGVVADRIWQERLRGGTGDAGEDELPPLDLACVLDESVLHRRRGPTSAMAGQLDHLATLARLGTVDLRVLPLDADGPAFGPFAVMGYGAELTDLVDTVLLPGPAGTERVIDDTVVIAYRVAFEDIQAAAADVEESLAMIKRAAGQWA